MILTVTFLEYFERKIKIFTERMFGFTRLNGLSYMYI